jgi:hypothetical protein
MGGAASSPDPILALLMSPNELQGISDQNKDIALNKLLAEVAADSSLVAALKQKLAPILAQLK